MAAHFRNAPPGADASAAAPHQPGAGGLSARYLDRFRVLANAFVAGAAWDDLALLAARAFHAVLGPSADVLVLAPDGDDLEIVASTGQQVGLLAGRLPLAAFPEVAAGLRASEAFGVHRSPGRRPLLSGGAAVVARLAVGATTVGALAGYLPPGERMPDPGVVRRSAEELAALLGAAFRSAAGRQLHPTPSQPDPSASVTSGADLPPSLLRHARGFGRPVAPSLAQDWMRPPADELPDLLRAVLDALPYAVTVVAADGRTLLRNAAADAAVRSGDAETAPTTGVASPLPAETGGLLAGLPAHAPRWLAAGGPVQDARFRYRDPATGDERWMATAAVPVRRPDGSLYGTVALTRDITVQVEAEEERDWLLHQSQAQRELLDRLIESAPVSILLLGPDLRVRLANRRFLESLTPPERGRSMMGLSIREIVPATLADWYAATVAAVLLAGTGRTHPEVRFMLNGEEALWEVAATPLRDTGGAITGVLFCSHDVTARVQASRAADRLLAEVSAERERIRAVLDLVPGGVIALDAGMERFLYVNQTALALATRPGAQAGGPVRDAGGLPYWDLLTPDGAPLDGQDSPLGRALRERRTIAGEEMQIQQADGSLTPVVVSATPLPPGPDGAPSGSVVVFVDITPLKEVERLKDDFLAMASHDLRGPLTVISGRVQLLRRAHAEGLATPESTLRALATIHDYVQQLNNLATTLLDVTLIRSGRFEVRPARMDLSALVRRIAEQLVLSSPLHTLRLSLPPAAVEGEWEETRIAQVVQNLVQNAIKYSPNGGQVEITVRTRVLGGQPRAVLTVRDQGIGIAPEERQRVFERFARGDGARRRGLGGTGLGLHICRGIVQAHGGTITVDGAPGGGSIFTVTLPLTRPAAG